MGNNRKPAKKGGAVALAAVLILLPVLYVASAGPALAMVFNGQMTAHAYWRVYAPVEKAVRMPGLDLVQNALGRYHQWCGARIDIHDDGGVELTWDDGSVTFFYP